jgi:hypothetical protein
MKNLLLSILAASITLVSFAQKGSKEKTRYTFERNPYTKLDQNLSFDRVITSDYQDVEATKRNEYHNALERAQLDQSYQRDVLGYEDPMLRSVMAPNFKGAPEQANVAVIKLDGFSYEEGGQIKINVHFSDYSPTFNIEENTSTGKWKFVYDIKQPVAVSVVGPNGTTLLNKGFSVSVKGFKNFTTSAQAAQYKNSVIANHNVLLKPKYNALYRDINKHVNYHLGYSKTFRTDIIFTAKGPKTLDYQDVNVAYVKARGALGQLILERPVALDKLKECIVAWDDVLKESNRSDKKARINADVTAALRLNKALAFIHLRRFNDADNELAQVEVDPNIKRKYRKEAEDLAAFAADEKKRNP